MTVEEYNVEKRENNLPYKQYYLSNNLPYNIMCKAVGNNFSRGREEGSGNFGEEHQDRNKMGMGKNIEL